MAKAKVHFQVIKQQNLEILNDKNRVIDVSQVEVGDAITFYNAEEKRLVSAEIVGLPLSNKTRSIVVYKPSDRKSVGTLRLDKFLVYKVHHHEVQMPSSSDFELAHKHDSLSL